MTGTLSLQKESYYGKKRDRLILTYMNDFQAVNLDI